jgi:hypothetical protein
MIVSESNIHFVAHLLKKYISNGFTEQTFYPSSKKANSVLRYFNIEDDWKDVLYEVEKSLKSHFSRGFIEIDNFFSEYNYIRIHNDGKRIYDFYDLDLIDNNGYMAMVIRCGDEIKFNKGRITIRQKLSIKNDKVLNVITY